MKFKRTILITTAIMIVMLTTWQGISNAKTESKTLSLSLRTDRTEYLLGDVIGLRFDISNRTDSPAVFTMPDVRFGTLKVYVSSDAINFREYVGPRWGSLRAGRKIIELASGQEFQSEATMLHNRTVATGHLSEMYAERIHKENLDTHFSMQSAGRFWLKAIYFDGKTRLESEPVVIEISHPTGMDALVWEKIKTDKAYAYFLQTGDLKFVPGSVEEWEFVASLQRLAEEFPGTKFAVKIEQGLAKRNAILNDLQR